MEFFFSVQSKGNQLTAMNLAINLFRQKGIFGLYKGFFPTMARDVSFSIFYFPLFAFLDSMVSFLNVLLNSYEHLIRKSFLNLVSFLNIVI